MKFTSSALKQRESARKYAHRRQTGELVRRRWEQNGRNCEGCGQVVDVIECAHVVGKGSRRAGIPEVWASTPELCAALCCAASYGYTRTGCHERVDRHLDNGLLHALEREAAVRLLRSLSPGAAVVGIQRGSSLDNIRELIRYAEANGIEP